MIIRHTRYNLANTQVGFVLFQFLMRHCRVGGNPMLGERLMSLGALVTAAWTALKLHFGFSQHSRLSRVSFRMLDEGLGLWATNIWESLRDRTFPSRWISNMLKGRFG